MPRFTLRDLFWLTLVVALLLTWWVDRGRLVGHIEAHSRQFEADSLAWDALIAENQALKEQIAILEADAVE